MPIEHDFKTKYSQTGKHLEHDVRNEQHLPDKIGIHGTAVAVDFDLCIADGACIPVCPVNVFDWFETAGHPASGKKADPAREKDCIFCHACETVCPVKAILISDPA